MAIPRAGDPDAHAVALEAFYDWELLEVLLEFIEDPSARSVGGVPQIARIYQYGMSEPFVWRDSSGNDYFGGQSPSSPQEQLDTTGHMRFAERPRGNQAL